MVHSTSRDEAGATNQARGHGRKEGRRVIACMVSRAPWVYGRHAWCRRFACPGGVFGSAILHAWCRSEHACWACWARPAVYSACVRGFAVGAARQRRELSVRAFGRVWTILSFPFFSHERHPSPFRCRAPVPERPAPRPTFDAFSTLTSHGGRRQRQKRGRGRRPRGSRADDHRRAVRSRGSLARARSEKLASRRALDPSPAVPAPQGPDGRRGAVQGAGLRRRRRGRSRAARLGDLRGTRSPAGSFEPLTPGPRTRWPHRPADQAHDEVSRTGWGHACPKRSRVAGMRPRGCPHAPLVCRVVPTGTGWGRA